MGHWAKGVTEGEAAKLIVEEARDILQKDLGMQISNWGEESGNAGKIFRARGASSFSVPIFGSPKGKSAIFFAKSKAMKDAISIYSTLFWLS